MTLQACGKHAATEEMDQNIKVTSPVHQDAPESVYQLLKQRFF